MSLPSSKQTKILNQKRAALTNHLKQAEGNPDPASLAQSYGLSIDQVKSILRGFGVRTDG